MKTLLTVCVVLVVLSIPALAWACTPGARRACTNPECEFGAHQECIDGGGWGPCDCDDPPPPPPDFVQPSQLFCGNVRLYQDDARYPWEGTPTINDAIENFGGTAVCRSAHGVEAHYYSVQNFEIRGWVRGNPGGPCTDYNAGDDEEYFIDVSLDLDWTPDDPSVIPLNRIEMLQAAPGSHGTLESIIPGTNIAKFGRRSISSGTSIIFGGPGQAVIHVEVDGWGPDRGGGINGVNYLRSGPPPGWIACGRKFYGGMWQTMYFSPNILNLQPGPVSDNLSDGDYVSVIGTYWRDGSHIGEPELDIVDQEKRCWRDVTGGTYWAEMHTPDKVRKLDKVLLNKPTPLASSLLAYTACRLCPLGCTARQHEDTVALPQPWPNTRISSISSAIWTGDYSPELPQIVDYNRVRFSGSFNGLSSALLGFYKVTWGPCTPNCSGTCGGPGSSDGCGNICPPTSCPGGQTCQGGSCVCSECGTPPSCHSCPDPGERACRPPTPVDCCGDGSICVRSSCGGIQCY